tara:strand:- start:212747 stop:214894 length:2148 start_codon:yes stop_codon:yes gene_type:complete
MRKATNKTTIETSETTSRKKRLALIAALVVGSSIGAGSSMIATAANPGFVSRGALPPLPVTTQSNGHVKSNPFYQPPRAAAEASIRLASGDAQPAIRLRPTGAPIGLNTIGEDPIRVRPSSIVIDQVPPAAVRTNPLIGSEHHHNPDLINTDAAQLKPMHSRSVAGGSSEPQLLIPAFDPKMNVAPSSNQAGGQPGDANLSAVNAPALMNVPGTAPGLPAAPVLKAAPGFGSVSSDVTASTLKPAPSMDSARAPSDENIQLTADARDGREPIAESQPIFFSISDKDATSEQAEERRVSELVVAAEPVQWDLNSATEPDGEMNRESAPSGEDLPQVIENTEDQALAALPSADGVSAANVAPPIAVAEPIAIAESVGAAKPIAMAEPFTVSEPIADASTEAVPQPLDSPSAVESSDSVASSQPAPMPESTLAPDLSELPNAVIADPTVQAPLASAAGPVVADQPISPLTLGDEQGTAEMPEALQPAPKAIYRDEPVVAGPVAQPEPSLNRQRYRSPVAVDSPPIAVVRGGQSASSPAPVSAVQRAEAPTLEMDDAIAVFEATPSVADEPKPAALFMSRAQVRSLTIGGHVRRVAVGDKNVCQAFAAGPNQLKLIGTGNGVTRLVVWADTTDSSPTRVRRFEVHVEDKAASKDGFADKTTVLNESIRRAFPTSHVYVQQLQDRLEVTGYCDSEETAKQIVRMIRKTCLIPVRDEIQVR